MKKTAICSCLLLAGMLTCSTARQASADEGMFLFNHPPVQQVQDKYGFTISEQWLDDIRLASVRFNNGGSGSFISGNGLVMTNHHVASDAIEDLSTPERDILTHGYLARNYYQELPVPNLELNCLVSIEDVTEQVNAAVKPGMTSAQAAQARKAIMSRIESESLKKTGLRSDVMNFYYGGLYQLYRYKKFTDVRLVWVPEATVGSFGGDVDNFEYPRESMDVAFFRVYEDGKPLKVSNYLPFNPKGVAQGDLIFVSGHPGTTNRQMTVADVLFTRDHWIKFNADFIKAAELAMMKYAERGPAQRAATEYYTGRYDNSRKVYTTNYDELLDSRNLQELQKREQALRALAKSQEPWETIETLRKKQAQFYNSYLLLEKGMGCGSRYFQRAQALVRLADELDKPSEKRLSEYRDSRLESLRESILADVKADPAVERVRLIASLTFLAGCLGPEHPDVQLVLQGKSPSIRADEILKNCRLGSVAERKRLLEGGKKAIAASDDSMLGLIKLIDARSRELRRIKEEEIDEPITAAYQRIAQEQFKAQGLSVPPDATFSLRLSYGEVKPYEEDGQQLSFQTTVSDLYSVNAAKQNIPPFDLPQVWLEAKSQVEPQAQLTFVSTADITGGNSGSPVIARDGSLVGLVFDSNRYGNVNDYIYGEVRARCISVGTPALLTALRDVYKADNLLDELFPRNGLKN